MRKQTNANCKSPNMSVSASHCDNKYSNVYDLSMEWCVMSAGVEFSGYNRFGIAGNLKVSVSLTPCVSTVVSAA
eukprot:m.146810 g.146810  ORF g.146810 m.146810 type:complete len:74 (+) comp24329_c0_seq5:442-663(+)